MAFFFLFLLCITTTINKVYSQSAVCRTYCGDIPIHYPLSIDDGCGSPYYRNMLLCSNSSILHFRTPSGSYPVSYIDYTEPHLVITDPFMWSCANPTDTSFAATPFSLDTSKRFSLSTRNEYLFFKCDKDSVLIEPKPAYCDRFPDRCGSSCDSSGYLCRNLPSCPNAILENNISCCTYYPKASESLRLMLKHCESYTGVYWKTIGTTVPPYDQVPEYGIRVDFEIPVTTRCLECEDKRKGGGVCGFDTESRDFVCLCQDGNATTFCSDAKSRHRTSSTVIAGTVVFSVAGAVGIGALVWFVRKIKSNKVVSCGVQTNENRYF
ncbi:wall-associated receptor kinase galacturonan-binding protein [Rhynchospora pubera]|uniref:Wall-associated receptor kinase galacturonan-binding protein n=1 Tax=Rhynchospora pubera TaxID=906938 RepID=A0AAV8GX37_9POAL|nr:wall-associated receptor kinase galacturonan-binding protein [Rhynchospora pubera]